MRKLFFTGLAALTTLVQSYALDYSSESACKNNDYIKEWGKLKVVGNQLCSESGQPVQLRGWSTHGHQWDGKYCYDDENDFAGMKKFGANVARIAMYVREYGWVNPEWVKKCIDWTASQKMYCLVDWHVLDPGTPTSYLGDNPDQFFADIAGYVKQKGYKHVLYEICNEPNENTPGDIYRPNLWKDIKTYADRVLPAIANVDPNAVVVVGTPQWDQAVVFPLEDPIENDYGLKLMYAFHYYACSHEMYLGGLQAAAGQIPMFVTEWSLTEHKGESGFCTDSGDKMLDVCNGLNLGGQKISWCSWSFSNVGGASASLTQANNYNDNTLTQVGKYIVGKLREGDKNPSKTVKSSPYLQAQKISGNSESLILMEQFDNGGEGVAYHEYDADWLYELTGGSCSAGEGNQYRKNECVDLGYTDKDTKEYFNVGYIVAGEWVKFTVNVEKAGYYRVMPYANAHKSLNVIGITVDGKNAVYDLNDKQNDKYKAVRIEINGTPDEAEGYGDWNFTSLQSAYNKSNNTDYGIYFDTPGEHVLAVIFYTETAGLGPIKLVPEGFDTGCDEIEAAPSFSIFPNPTEGTFNVSYDGEAQMEIVNMLGAKVYESNFNGETSVNADLAKGVYFVKVISDDKVMVKKLLVKFKQ